MIKALIFDGKPILITPNKDGTWKIDKITILRDRDKELESKICIPRCNINFNSLEILTSNDGKDMWHITILDEKENE